jgi:hypothetical protein
VKYTVWVFPIVRVKVPDVEASSQEEAMKKVDESTDFHALLDRENIEFAEEIDCFHVDEDNDPEYERSQWYDADYSPM